MDNVLILCRVCLGKGEISIFREARFKDSIRDRLMACASIRVDLNDGFPSNICTQCLSELDNAYNFRLKCERSEKKLMECFGLFTNTLDNEHKLCAEDETMDSTIVQCDNEDEVLECVESIKVEDDQGCYETNISRNLKSEPTCSQSEHPKTIQNGGKILKLKRKMNEKLHRQKRSRDRKCKVTQPAEKKRVYVEKPKERDKTRKHMCTICGKTFLFHGNLLDHERVHSGDKPYSCNICNRRFAQSGHLMVHARTHTGDKPYQCEICPRAFTVSHALKKHLRTHTGERPYPCTLCDKSFVTSYHLSNHFKRHMGDKRFKCDWPDCQQGFVNISEMKRHRARHEKIKISPKNKSTCDRLQSIPIIDLQIIPANISGNINPYNDFRRCYESIF